MIQTHQEESSFFHKLFGALAEFERDLIRDRTVAGLAAARARGRKGGRPRLMNDDKVQLATTLLKSRSLPPVAEVCSTLGVSKATLYRYVSSALAS